MKVSKKTGLSLGIEADITGQGTNLSRISIGREISVAGSEVTARPASDWLRDISCWK